MHGRWLQSLSLVRGIFWVFLPPPCWDLRILDSIESGLYRLGLFCASFCGTTKSLSTLARSGLPSLSWTHMQACLYSIVELTFGLLTINASATVLCIHTYKWSRGHIPIRVLPNVEYSVGCLLDHLLWNIVGIDVYLCPHNIRWIPLATSFNSVMVLLIARRGVLTNEHNGPIILSDHHS